MALLIAAALFAVLAVTAVLVASVLRPPDAASFLLAAYVVGFAEIVLVAVLLSPLDAYDRYGVAAAQLVLLACAGTAWVLVGRPLPPLPSPRPLPALVRAHPALAVLAAVVGAALVYELAVGIAATPNTWDSLTYHLSRAAWWRQHGGVEWIPGVIDERQNAFPPNAEIAILYTLVGAAGDRLAALPQFLSLLALLVAVAGTARRLGFSGGGSLFAALLFATLPMIALQASTTQTDLVIAALASTAAFFLLGRTRPETALAGLAVGLALGTKLTVLLVLPVLALLAVLYQRGRLLLLAGSIVAAFAALSIWGYARNLIETGAVLGEGVGRVEHQADASLGGSASTAVRVLYRFLDLSGTEPLTKPAGLVAALVTCVAVAVAFVYWHRRSIASSSALARAGVLALPLAAAVAVLAFAKVVKGVLVVSGLPMNPPETTAAAFDWTVNQYAHEDVSYFGPVAALVLLPAAAYGLIHSLRLRTMPGRAALALSLPIFVVGIAVTYKYNVWLGRFMLLPVALTAPLLAGVYRYRAVAVGVVATAICWLGLTHASNVLKPTGFAGTTPVWKLGRGETWALTFGSGSQLARAVDELDRTVPGDGCLGALLGVNEASYPLFGADLDRRVTYVEARNPVADAESNGLSAVVVRPTTLASRFEEDDEWDVRPLGDDYWALVTRADTPAGCSQRN